MADAFDTITSDRTYKKARAAEDALNELERCSNAQFDGSIVALFVRTMRQLPNPVIEVASLVQEFVDFWLAEFFALLLVTDFGTTLPAFPISKIARYVPEWPCRDALLESWRIDMNC